MIYNAETEKSRIVGSTEQATVEMKLSALDGKRRRVLEAFFDGTIDKTERDQRTASIDLEISTFRQMLLDSTYPGAGTEKRGGPRRDSAGLSRNGSFSSARTSVFCWQRFARKSESSDMSLSH